MGKLGNVEGEHFVFTERIISCEDGKYRTQAEATELAVGGILLGVPGRRVPLKQAEEWGLVDKPKPKPKPKQRKAPSNKSRKGKTAKG